MVAIVFDFIFEANLQIDNQEMDCTIYDGYTDTE
jgi:hypothetical protein